MFLDEVADSLGLTVNILFSLRFCQVSAAIRDVVPSLAKDEFTDVSVSYVASMCCTLMDLKHTSDEEWAGVGKLLALVAKDLPSDAAAIIKTKCADMMVVEEADDDDEDAEELCNCQFTLAYGKDGVRGSARHPRLPRGGH